MESTFTTRWTSPPPIDRLNAEIDHYKQILARKGGGGSSSGGNSGGEDIPDGN